MTNERNDLRTRRVASWSQTQEGGRSDEKAHQKKEDEKSQVETWSQTQTIGVADEKTQRKEEAKESQVETWSQAQKVGVADEITQCKRGAENGKVEIQDQTQKVNEKENHHMKEAEKAKEVVEGERLDEKDCRKRDTKRVKKGNYDPNPMNCGDCPFETHHENELIEHVKTHMDQVKKNTRVAHNDHENTAWRLWEDWEYANEVEEEVVTHIGFFSIVGHDRADDGPRKEMSDQRASHKNKEFCATKLVNNCTGVIETNVERVCFDVNELVCDLVEAVHYETLEET